MRLRDSWVALVVFCMFLYLLPIWAIQKLQTWWVRLDEFYNSLPEDHWVYHWSMNDEWRYI